jgi:DNA modification methylase
VRIEKLKIEQLNPAAYNPRVDLKPGDQEYERLKKSILEFGYVEPIVWNERTGNVVGGHQRLKVLIELGYELIDAVVVDLDEDKEKALNLALNKIDGDWDLNMLSNLLTELKDTGIDMDITGFSDEEIMELIGKDSDEGEIVEDDFDVAGEAEKIDEPITKPGDIWVLGRHRLMCGDSTSIDDMRRLMSGEMADMIFTDPPYNVAYEGKTADRLKIKNDSMEDSQFYEFLLQAYKCMFVVTKPGGAIYVAHADSEGVNFRTAMINAGWLLKQCLIWAKNSLVLGRQDYHWRHEPILYGWKPGASHKWYGGRKQDTIIEDKHGVSIAEKDGRHVITIQSGVHTLVLSVPEYRIEYASDDAGTSLWRIERPSRNADHPTMKPVALVARAIMNSSRTGDIVLDPFGGSGSTLIAAEQMGRCARLMELDPKYADVIVRRWEEFTGNKAEKLGVVNV